jgi:DNA-binding response OmpR family regulator
VKASLPIVLYVDNDADDVFLMQRTVALSDAGFCLCTASGLQTAIDHVENGELIIPSLIIVDYGLDKGGAPDFLTWLRGRSHCAAIPAIVMSGRDDEGCVARCYLAGAGSFLQKAAALDELTRVVCAVGLCVASTPVTLEPLKKLAGYRMSRYHELSAELERNGSDNAALREKLKQLRAELDIARAEAKENKRQYPYPKKCQ